MVEDPKATLSLLSPLPQDRGRLLVIEDVSSLIVGLPATGTLTIGRSPESDVQPSDAGCPRPAAGTLTVGRSPECDVTLSEAAGSRRHAQLHVAAGPLTLEDLGSAPRRRR